MSRGGTQEWIADTEAVEEVQVMDEVPHALRREISYAVNRKVFEKLHVFHDFPQPEQKSIAAMMTPLQVRRTIKCLTCEGCIAWLYPSLAHRQGFLIILHPYLQAFQLI